MLAASWIISSIATIIALVALKVARTTTKAAIRDTSSESTAYTSSTGPRDALEESEKPTQDKNAKPENPLLNSYVMPLTLDPFYGVPTKRLQTTLLKRVLAEKEPIRISVHVHSQIEEEDKT